MSRSPADLGSTFGPRASGPDRVGEASESGSGYRLRRLLPALAVFLFLCVGQAAAQSIFSLQGPGVGGPAAGGRGRGLGGVELALADTLRGANINPALSCLQHEVTLAVTIVPELIWAHDNREKRWWGTTSLSAARLQVPLRPRLALALGLSLERSLRAKIRWSDEADTVVVEHRLNREGDHFAVPLTLSWGEWHGWSLGLGVDYLFASLREEAGWLIDEPGFVPADWVTLERLSGPAPVAAVSFRPAPRGRLALIYRHRASLRGDREVSGPGGKIGTYSLRVRYPSLWGMGAALEAGRFVIGADAYYEPWEDYRKEVRGEAEEIALGDTWTWAVGLERQADAEALSFWGRYPLRLGYRRATLPSRAFGNGSSVQENLFTLGTGWIFAEGRAALDLSFELGSRGDIEENGGRERFLRLVLSVAGREPWKKPERRGPWWGRD